MVLIPEYPKRPSISTGASDFDGRDWPAICFSMAVSLCSAIDGLVAAHPFTLQAVHA
jgi:hypothetical protein